MSGLSGLHHVTAITASADQTRSFLVGTLGLRQVKWTVNFDDPSTPHLYFGDRSGSPGTLLTYFEWPRVAVHRPGTGEVAATCYGITPGQLGHWDGKLTASGVATEKVRWFGEDRLTFTAPDGTRLELVEMPGPPGDGSEHGPERVRGLAWVTLATGSIDATARAFERWFGFSVVASDGERLRLSPLAAAGEPATGGIELLPASSRSGRPRLGSGGVHHVALRCRDDAAQMSLRERLEADGIAVTPVRNRVYFRSIYFREPGGVLVEVATDGPGFAVDEPAESLGTTLRLPPWLSRGSAP